MNNKKIIFVILLFIGISFIVYSFANPLEEGQDLSEGNNGVSENNNSQSSTKNSSSSSSSKSSSSSSSVKKSTSTNDKTVNSSTNSGLNSSSTGILSQNVSGSSGSQSQTSGSTWTPSVPDYSGNGGTSAPSNPSVPSNPVTPVDPTPAPSPVDPEPVVPVRPVVQTTVVSKNPALSFSQGSNSTDLYLSGSLQAEVYHDPSINDEFNVYRISLSFVPSDAGIVGTNVTYRFSKTMGLHGELRKASLLDDKSFDVELVINANLFSSSKSLVVYIDWDDGNGETAYTINLRDLKTY